MLTERQIDDGIAACERIEELNAGITQNLRNIVAIFEDLAKFHADRAATLSADVANAREN